MTRGSSPARARLDGHRFALPPAGFDRWLHQIVWRFWSIGPSRSTLTFRDAIVEEGYLRKTRIDWLEIGSLVLRFLLISQSWTQLTFVHWTHWASSPWSKS